MGINCSFLIHILNNNIMKKFKLYFIGGITKIVEGTSIANACTNAGYSAGFIRSLDYWSEL